MSGSLNVASIKERVNKTRVKGFRVLDMQIMQDFIDNIADRYDGTDGDIAREIQSMWKTVKNDAIS